MGYEVNGQSVGRDPNSFVRDSSYNENFDKLGNSVTNVKVFHNFLSVEECNKILSIRGTPVSSDSKQWHGRIYFNQKIDSLTRSLGINIKKVIQKEYDIKVKQNDSGYNTIDKHAYNISSVNIVSFPSGKDMALHVDDLGTEEYHMSSIVYLNDNYEGGEIFFPTHDLLIKPKQGDLIIFPGNLNYAHQVNSVTSGDRYTIPIWYEFVN
jgi:hypothetical protein